MPLSEQRHTACCEQDLDEAAPEPRLVCIFTPVVPGAAPHLHAADAGVRARCDINLHRMTLVGGDLGEGRPAELEWPGVRSSLLRALVCSAVRPVSSRPVLPFPSALPFL